MLLQHKSKHLTSPHLSDELHPKMCPDYQTIQLFVHVADTAVLFCHLQKFRLFGDMSQAGIIHVMPEAQHSSKFSRVGLCVCNCVVLSSWLRNSSYFFLAAHMLCLQQHGAAPPSPTLNELLGGRNLLSSLSFFPLWLYVTRHSVSVFFLNRLDLPLPL